MEKYKKRVIKEYKELKERQIKLGNFVCDMDRFNELNQLEQYLLDDQLTAIDAYIKALEMRLVYWGISINEL